MSIEEKFVEGEQVVVAFTAKVINSLYDHVEIFEPTTKSWFEVPITWLTSIPMEEPQSAKAIVEVEDQIFFKHKEGMWINTAALEEDYDWSQVLFLGVPRIIHE